MAAEVATLQRCERCEHEGEHMCIALHEAVRTAVAEVNGRAQRHGYRMPPARVVIDCPAFWRKGRQGGSP